MEDIEIKKIILRIDQKIKSLETAKQVLIQEFAGERAIVSPSFKAETRKGAVVKLIQEHGPLLRKEIIEMTGFPLGTLAYVLNDKNLFCNKDGKWDLVSRESKEKKQLGLIGNE